MAPGSCPLPPLYEAVEGHSLLSFLWEMRETKCVFFFFSLFFPIFTHSRHSRCASVHSGGCSAIVFLGTCRGSKERLIRFDERRVHAWAPMSPAMRQLWSRSERLWCHLLNDEVGRSPFGSASTSSSCSCVQTHSVTIGSSHCNSNVTANTSMHQISSSVITEIRFDWAIMPDFVSGGLVISWWPLWNLPSNLTFTQIFIYLCFFC